MKKYLAMLLVTMLLLGLGLTGCQKGGEASSGAKTVTVMVTHKDQSQKEFVYHTDADSLGTLLKIQRLIQGKSSVYGLYITTVDGEMADETKEEWWCLTAGGESVMTGVDTTPIKDGDQYELTFKIGY